MDQLGEVTTKDMAMKTVLEMHNHKQSKDEEEEPIPLESTGKSSNDGQEHKSFGVARIEAIASVLNLPWKIAIFATIFLVGYAFGLDAVLRNAYQPFATASYGEHSLLSTINVLRVVFAAGAQLTAPKLADGAGRVEILGSSVIFYVIGTIVEATSTSIQSFAAGAVLYTLGFTIVQILCEILLSDLSSTRSRLWAIYIPNLHFLITTWVSGNISSAVLRKTTWQWGIGMWGIIFTACILPLIASLVLASRRAARRPSWPSLSRPVSLKMFFGQLDIVGLVLIIAIFALTLTPLTIAGGFKEKWSQAHVLAPLVAGFLCIPAFVIWERRTTHPLIPLSLMKDRAVWSPLAIAVTVNFAYSMQGNYLFTLLIVAFDFSIAAATRIATLYLFMSFAVGPLCGIVVYFVRRLKYLVVAGTVLFMVAYGLLIRYRSGDDGASHSGIIGAEIVLGIAGGMFPYAALASMQTALKHEQLATMTGLYLACHSIGGALGSAVSGAIWTQVLPSSLAANLSFQPDPTLSMAAFGNPFEIVAQFPFGSEVRNAIADSYQHVQRLLCITGICLCVPLIGFALLLRDPKLTDNQTLVHEDGEEISQPQCKTS